MLRKNAKNGYFRHLICLITPQTAAISDSYEYILGIFCTEMAIFDIFKHVTPETAAISASYEYSLGIFCTDLAIFDTL